MERTTNDKTYYNLNLCYSNQGGHVIHIDNAIFSPECDQMVTKVPANDMPTTVYIKHDEGYRIEAAELYLSANFHCVGRFLPVAPEHFQKGHCERGDYDYKFTFVMPAEDMSIHMRFIKEDSTMETNKVESNNGVVDTFELPEEIAYELSDLLTRQTIRERLLMQATGDPTKFDQIEGMLIPITSRIEALKDKITKELVPEKYRKPQYIWSYNGVEIDGVSAQVLLAT